MGSAGMPYSVFAQSYRELNRPVFYSTLVMLGGAGLVLLAYPLLAGLYDMDWLGSLNSASFLFGDEPGKPQLSSLSGWLQAAGFGLFFPLAAAIYAIMMGSWLVAGEEERGSLGLLLAAPLSRQRFMLEKTGVLLVVIARPLLVLGLLLLLADRLGVALPGLASRMLSLFLLALLFGALAMALGSLTGRRRFSLVVALVGLALAFVVSRIPGGLPAGHVLRLASPLYLYETAVVEQFFLLALLGQAVICLAAGWAGFERRDLAV